MRERIHHTDSGHDDSWAPSSTSSQHRRRRRARMARHGDSGGDDAPRGRGASHHDGGRGRPAGRSGGRRGGRRGGPPLGRGFGRRRDRGEVRIAILLLLAEEPMHGYRIMREVAVRSGGSWRLSPGAVYPTLGILEAEGLVTASGDTGRSVYALTDAGREASAELAGTTPPWESPDDDSLHELHHALEALVAATRQVAEVGDSRQHADAVAALVQARRRLYSLLAEEPAGEQPVAEEPGSTEQPGHDHP